VTYFRSSSETFCSEFVENNWIFDFLSENYPISKKNRPKRSLESKVISILNSLIFRVFFFGKNRVICTMSYFYTLVFVEYFFQARCILQEKMMVLVLKTS
jgi:hypothetical protein